MKSTRLEVKNYLRGGLGAILEENDSRGTAGGSSGGSPRIEREEGEERKREEREEEEMLAWLKLLISRANQCGVTESCCILWHDW
jgi:hypothetical protein